MESGNRAGADGRDEETKIREGEPRTGLAISLASPRELRHVCLITFQSTRQSATPLSASHHPENYSFIHEQPERLYRTTQHICPDIYISYTKPRSSFRSHRQSASLNRVLITSDLRTGNMIKSFIRLCLFDAHDTVYNKNMSIMITFNS